MKSSDADAVQILLDVVWADEERSASEFAWLLESGGVLLGVGRMVPRNQLHPHRLTLELAVTDSAYAAGEAAVLLEHLITSAPPQTRWRIQVSESHHAAQAFLKRAGFAEVRRTWTPRVPLSAFPADWLLIETQQVQRLGYRLGLEALEGAAFRTELTRAHLEAYTATHQINPPAELSLAEWEEVFLDDLHEVFTARLSGRLAAFASLREGGEVYWFATLPEFAADAPLLNAALKRAELEVARAQEFPSLNFELDSTDSAALNILVHLPISPGKALLTFQT